MGHLGWLLASLLRVAGMAFVGAYGLTMIYRALVAAELTRDPKPVGVALVLSVGLLYWAYRAIWRRIVPARRIASENIGQRFASSLKRLVLACAVVAATSWVVSEAILDARGWRIGGAEGRVRWSLWQGFQAAADTPALPARPTGDSSLLLLGRPAVDAIMAVVFLTLVSIARAIRVSYLRRHGRLGVAPAPQDEGPFERSLFNTLGVAALAVMALQWRLDPAHFQRLARGEDGWLQVGGAVAVGLVIVFRAGNACRKVVFGEPTS